jgi:cytochrome c
VGSLFTNLGASPKFLPGSITLFSFYAAPQQPIELELDGHVSSVDGLGAGQIRAAIAKSRLQALRCAVAAAVTLCVAEPGVAQTVGNPDRGKLVFERQCALCHTIGKDEPNRFGPNLFGIAERKAGTAPNYRYSPEFLTMATWTWSPDGIASFVAAPALTIPGNRMSVFQGVADKDMNDLIAFIAAHK